MKQFLLNRTNWMVLIIWATAASCFNLWQLATGHDPSGLGMIFMLVPCTLLGLRSYMVLKELYRF